MIHVHNKCRLLPRSVLTQLIMLAAIWGTVVTDNNVVVMNKKDLTDRGININSEELDYILPVIAPSERPKFVDLPERTQDFEQTQPLPDDSRKRHKNKVKDTGVPTESSNSPRIKNTRNSEHMTNSSGKANASKPRRIYNNYNVTLQNNDNKQTKNNTKARKLTRKQTYYNVYDVDKLTTVRRVEEPEQILPIDKQKILNNTLASYGLRLDTQGQNIILHDIKEQLGSKKSRNRTKGKKGEIFPNTKNTSRLIKGKYKTTGVFLEGTEDHSLKSQTQRKDGGIAINAQQKEEDQGHSKRKSKQEDIVKSLWNILQNVSKKWK